MPEQGLEFLDVLNRSLAGKKFLLQHHAGVQRILAVFKRRRKFGSLEDIKPPPNPSATAILGSRIEGRDTQDFIEGLGLPGLPGALSNLAGFTRRITKDVTREGDVSSGRIGKAYGAADLRIATPGIAGGPTRAPTADPNRTPITIPRPEPELVQDPIVSQFIRPVFGVSRR